MMLRGIYKRTKEMNEKMSKFLKNRIIIWGDKISSAKMGHTCSDES